MSATTGTSNYTTFLDSSGQQVYPCRCGETHDGDYGLYDHAHHNCFHDEPLLILDANEGYLMCPSCGKTFHTREVSR